MRIPRTHFIESERTPLIGPSRQTPPLSHRNDSDTALREHPIDNPPPRWKKILDFVFCRQCAGEPRTDDRPAVTPIMNEHSRYTGGEYQPPLRTDVPVNVEKLAQLMDSAAPRIERLMNSRGFQRQPRQILAQVGQADPAQRYSLTSPHNGFVDRHQLNMAKEDVILPPVRRPSLVSASSASLAPLMPPPARKRT